MTTPETIRFTCTACKSVLSVPIANQGKHGKCPSCHAPITVPLLNQATLNNRNTDEVKSGSTASKTQIPGAKGDLLDQILGTMPEPRQQDKIGSKQASNGNQHSETAAQAIVSPAQAHSIPAQRVGNQPAQKKSHPENISFAQALSNNATARIVFFGILLCIVLGITLAVLPEFELYRRGKVISSRFAGITLLVIAFMLAFNGSPIALLKTLKSWRLMRFGVDVPWRVIEYLDNTDDIKIVRIEYQFNGTTYTKKKYITLETINTYRLTLNPDKPESFILQP